METNNHRCSDSGSHFRDATYNLEREKTKSQRNKLDRLNDLFAAGLERDRTREREREIEREKNRSEHTTQKRKTSTERDVVRVTDQFL